MKIFDFMSQINLNLFDNFKEMEEIVLSYPKLHDRINGKAEET